MYHMVQRPGNVSVHRPLALVLRLLRQQLLLKLETQRQQQQQQTRKKRGGENWCWVSLREARKRKRTRADI